MLAKSRTSALIMVLAFIFCWAAAYFPLYSRYALGGGVTVPLNNPGDWAALAMTLFLLFVMAVFVSRMRLVTQMGERGFGLGGLARWSTLGVLTGTAHGLLYSGMLGWLGDTSLRATLEPLVTVAVLVLLGWLVFQRFVLRFAPSADPYLPGRGLALAAVIASALVIAAGFFLLAAEPGALWPAAYVNFGLGALLCAAADLLQARPAGQKYLRPAGLLLILLGLLIAVAA